MGEKNLAYLSYQTGALRDCLFFPFPVILIDHDNSSFIALAVHSAKTALSIFAAHYCCALYWHHDGY